MDPFSALSIATAVTQFLDFTGTLVAGTWKIYKGKPLKGAEKYADIRTITKALVDKNRKLSKALNQKSYNDASEQERDLAVLAKGCNEVSERILSALDRLGSQSPNQFWASFNTALKTVWSQDEI